jgi:hypothetical protein
MIKSEGKLAGLSGYKRPNFPLDSQRTTNDIQNITQSTPAYTKPIAREIKT